MCVCVHNIALLLLFTNEQINVPLNLPYSGTQKSAMYSIHY